MFYNETWSTVKLQSVAMAIHHCHSSELPLPSAMEEVQSIIEDIIFLNS